MAINWKEAQKNEKDFWYEIYISETSNMYRKTDEEGWFFFAKEVIERHNTNFDFLSNKKILDIGSGPGGLAKGFHYSLKKNLIKNSQIIATDPLMDFYKDKIGLMKEDENLKLLSSKGECIDLENESIDIIFSSNVLDHCQNPASVINEAYRILKPGGIFFVSLHLLHNYLGFLSNYAKYFDKNHPHHFTLNKIKKIFLQKFANFNVTRNVSIIYDQKNFTFLNILKSPDKFRSLKRFSANYILYTCYLDCKKELIIS